MNWYQDVFELIDMRTFSNLWFWIALAVTWSTASHWVLGVPWDMAIRARKSKSPGALEDFEAMVRINRDRILFIARQSGLLLAGMVSFVLTVCATLGFIYAIEFCQALFLLGLPLCLVGLLSVHTAHSTESHALRGAALIARLSLHRRFTQLIGMISIFVTAMWGMYQNMTLGVL